MAEKTTTPLTCPTTDEFKQFLNNKPVLSKPLTDWEKRILGGSGGYQSQVKSPPPKKTR
jgi:hypothetical protein